MNFFRFAVRRSLSPVKRGRRKKLSQKTFANHVGALLKDYGHKPSSTRKTWYTKADVFVATLELLLAALGERTVTFQQILQLLLGLLVEFEGGENRGA